MILLAVTMTTALSAATWAPLSPWPGGRACASPARRYTALTPATSRSSEALASPKSIAVFGSKKSSLSIAGESGPMLRLRTTTFCASVDVEDRHPVDRALRVRPRRRVGDVVRADDEGDVGARELGVDVVHVEELRVRDVRLGEQHVHVARHPARDRVDRVLHRRRRALEEVGQLAHRVLRLGDRQPVARDDDDLLRVGEHDRGVVGVISRTI